MSLNVVNITSSILVGSGTLPKSVSRNAHLLLDASTSINARSYEWELVNKPNNAGPVIISPISSITRFGPLDEYGVYQIRCWINKHGQGEKSKHLTVSVPAVISSTPTASTPNYARPTPGILNGSFEIGIFGLPGWALYWNIVDDANILDSGGGATRGRCIPTNFTTDGTYAMTLGDDLGSSTNLRVGDEFSVYQDVDLTNRRTLKIKLKLNKS
jgi:hypothetical protein